MYIIKFMNKNTISLEKNKLASCCDRIPRLVTVFQNKTTGPKNERKN